MYKEMYLLTFNAITDALRLLEAGNIGDAKKVLIDAQCAAEEIYISAGDDQNAPVKLLPLPETGESIPE